MPAAAMRKRAAEGSFISSNSYDVHNDFSCALKIPYQSDFVLVYNPAKGSAPWYTSRGLLAFLDILMLGWLQRYTFMTSVSKIEYDLRKTFID